MDAGSIPATSTKTTEYKDTFGIPESVFVLDKVKLKQI